MTIEILCEEFRVADEIKIQKKQQKRSKRKARRQIKTSEMNEVCFEKSKKEEFSLFNFLRKSRRK
jgi:hypothetical protein